MPVYRFNEFLQVIHSYVGNNGHSLEDIRANILAEECLDHEPHWVVDHPERWKNPNVSGQSNLFLTMEEYSHLCFQDFAHMAPDHSTAYFDNSEDAMMFFLSAV